MSAYWKKKLFGTATNITMDDVDEAMGSIRQQRRMKNITQAQYKKAKQYLDDLEETLLEKQERQTAKEKYIADKLRRAEEKKLNATKSSDVFTNRKNFKDTAFDVKGNQSYAKKVFALHCMNLVRKSISELGGIQLQIGIDMEFRKEVDHQTVYVFRTFWKKTQIVLPQDSPSSMTSEFVEFLDECIEDAVMKGSGFTFHQVISIHININKYVAPRGGTFKPLPKWIQGKKACVNVDNTKYPDRCFEFSVLAALHPEGTHRNRASSYSQWFGSLDVSMLKFPVKISYIPAFETANNLSIRVFGVEDNKIVPIKYSADLNAINLLLFDGHYVWVKNLDWLLNSDKLKTRFNCHRCLYPFLTKEALAKHNELECGEQAQVTPDKGSVCQYSRIDAQLEHPFVIYADGESLVQKISDSEGNCLDSWTHKIQRHDYVSVAAKVVSSQCPSYETQMLRTGADCLDKFFEWIQHQTEVLMKKMRTVRPMMNIDWKDVHQATNCHICGEVFKVNDVKVKDHDHITGNYRGMAHQACNINLRTAKFIPCFFHNLRGYDSHMLVKQIGKYILSADGENHSVEPIADNEQQYRMFSWRWSNNKSSYCVRFLDSAQFMSASLESLAKNLSSEAKHYTRCEFGDKADLMTQKGHFPYEWFDGDDKFKCGMPPIEAFYSTLSGKGIEPDEHAHASNVYASMGCGNMKDYMETYLRSDVALLADVFEAFRKTSLSFYGLDPVHFFSAPSLAFQASLKKSKAKLELLSDIDMYLFVERAKRGGICMISNRYAKANNPYVKDYEPTADKSYIMYLDANNLYGWAMSQPLPVSEFEWCSMALEDIMAMGDNDEYGCFVEVDMEIPVKLHDLMNDYPLAPERMAIDKSMLSPFASSMYSELGMSGKPCEKLVPNLLPKKSYIAHYRNLQYYVKLGLEVTAVKRVLKFKQSPWLKSYIDFNTTQRSLSKNDFEKDFFKLMNNAVFGKTMEDVRGHQNVRLVDEDKALKLAAKPTYKSHRIISEELVAVHQSRKRVMLDKPMSVGVAILDLSKLWMAQFHYDTMMKMYTPETCRLLMTDTDSLVYHIKTDDVYKDFVSIKDLLDTSDYPKEHPLYSAGNKKVIGKFKDECVSGKFQTISEFVGLRPKMYSFTTSTDKCSSKAKGVQKKVTKSFTTNNYKSVLDSLKPTMNTQVSIRSFDHVVYTIKQNKTSLSAYDDKRWLLDDGIQSLAYGHYRVVK